MKIRPLHDRVIVKRLEEVRTTASGIVIPDTAAEKPDQGEIIAIGNGNIQARPSRWMATNYWLCAKKISWALSKNKTSFVFDFYAALLRFSAVLTYQPRMRRSSQNTRLA